MKIVKIKTGFKLFGKIKWFKQKWYFRIEKNGNTLCHSEKYANYGDMVHAIQIIQKEIPNAEIIDIIELQNRLS